MMKLFIDRREDRNGRSETVGLQGNTIIMWLYDSAVYIKYQYTTPVTMRR